MWTGPQEDPGACYEINREARLSVPSVRRRSQARARKTLVQADPVTVVGPNIAPFR